MWNNKCNDCAPNLMWLSASETTTCPNDGAHADIASVDEGA